MYLLKYIYHVYVRAKTQKKILAPTSWHPLCFHFCHGCVTYLGEAPDPQGAPTEGRTRLTFSSWDGIWFQVSNQRVPGLYFLQH